MALLTQAPKGTKDIIDCAPWQRLESMLRGTAHYFGCSEIRFPAFEHTELFIRGVGDTTDVVQKEMYTFTDKGGRSLSLRPEGTASVCRAVLENSLLSRGLPVKLYYIAPNFRYEQPQAGRLRQHHQFGVECFGSALPSADAELISLADTFLKRIGLTNFTLELNSIGCSACRPLYNAALKQYLSAYELCGLCAERAERNPLRVLDCKNPGCRETVRGAPRSLDSLCPDCAAHFEAVKRYLDDTDIKYTINPLLVRGLDYYTRTVFEFKASGLGAQDTVCAGGRYDGMLETLGGAPTPALGFGSGLERLLLAMEAQGVALGDDSPPDIYICNARTDDGSAALLTYRLRNLGVSAERDITGRSLKAQMKQADKLNARYVIVIGDDEVASQTVKIKEMRTGSTSECELDADAIKRIIK